IANVQAGVQREIALYAAPLDTLAKPNPPWVKICDRSDNVTDFAVRGGDIYLMTHRDSPRFSVVKTTLAAPDMAKAATVVPASGEVLFAVGAARDALYIESRDGPIKRLKRMPWNAKDAATVKLPLEGPAS